MWYFVIFTSGEKKKKSRIFNYTDRSEGGGFVCLFLKYRYFLCFYESGKASALACLCGSICLEHISPQITETFIVSLLPSLCLCHCIIDSTFKLVASSPNSFSSAFALIFSQYILVCLIYYSNPRASNCVAQSGHSINE